MKTQAPTLSPLLRNDAQGLMLASMYLDPNAEQSLTQIAKAGHVSIATAQRELERLQDTGFVLSRKLGQTRLIRPNTDHPLFRAVQELVLYAYGPVAVITPLIQKVGGLHKAFIYGSWAARISGHPGLDPNDIDLMFIGDISNKETAKIGAAASEKMGRVVNVNNLSKKDWDAAESGFVKTIKSRPLVELPLNA